MTIPELVEFRTVKGLHTTVRQDEIVAVDSLRVGDRFIARVFLRPAGLLIIATDYPYEVVAWHWRRGWSLWGEDGQLDGPLVADHDCQYCGLGKPKVGPGNTVCPRCHNERDDL